MKRNVYSSGKHFYIILIMILSVILLALIGFAVRLTRSLNRESDLVRPPSDTLVGIWVYDRYTKYEFENDGSGCMVLEEMRFPYTYFTQGDLLYIDFESESLWDATYTYSIDGNKLTLTGGEGTVGGIYQLTKATPSPGESS